LFTGIVEEVGKVSEVRKTGTVTRISVQGSRAALDAQINDSVAVGGVCLTVTAKYAQRLAFDVVAETLQRSTLRYARPGDGVNLERALPMGGRVGGHFVLGHVDGVGKVVSVVDHGNGRSFRISVPPEIMRLVVHKGSITLDGVSLTIADLEADTFSVWIIPHTLRNTTFRERREGELVNVEADILGKYVDRLLALHMRDTGITAARLAEAGFAAPEDVAAP